VKHHLEPQPVLYFMTPDRRVSRFAADELPAPLHLGRALWGAHYLTAGEKLRVAYGLARLRLTDAESDPPLLPWLQRHRQTPRTIDRFWGIVLTSALNETVERVGLKYARKVFVDGFMTHRDGFTVEVPSVPLGRLYGEELRHFFTRHGVTLRENAAATALVPTPDGRRVAEVSLRDGTTISADEVVLAVPFDRVLPLLPAEWASRPEFAAAGKLTPSPITSVHLWYDRPVTDLPHAVFVDCLGQWLFNRGEFAPGEFYVQVVVSAARPLRGVGRDEIARRVAAELASLFPAAASAQLLRTKVVTELTATFSAPHRRRVSRT
jgi:squalene-associated FAD-dependent desaturase